MEDLTGAELHFDSDSEELNNETESTLQDHSNIAPEEHHGDASDEERISAKEDFIEYTVSTSEHQMSVPLKEAISRGETVDLNAPSSVDEGSVNNADIRSVESAGDSG